MKQLLIISLFFPFLVLAQGSKPAPAAKKPATAAAKPAGTTQKKPAATAAKPGTAVKKPAAAAGVKKPVATTPKKPNPQVVKLTEKAYEYYRDSKDAECEKTIKQILALDPRNKDAYLLRANIAMFNGKMEEMWSNLDKIYKFNPNEPEIYSNFAVTHLNYAFMSDSVKQVLCRKTIKLASRRADGYVNLGMVAMAGGYYQDALSCFDISFSKQWKDTMNRIVLNLYYARCQYGVGDTLGAIARLDASIPQIKGNDRYTSMFLRAKYKLDMRNADVSNDMDSLNRFAADQPDIWILNAKYLSLTGRKDSACMFARQVRATEGGEGFDLSEYCADLTRKLDMSSVKKLTYAMGDMDFTVVPEQFNYSGGIRFRWEKSRSFQTSAAQYGVVSILPRAIDSAMVIGTDFNHESDISLDRSICFWLSRLQYSELKKGSLTALGIGKGAVSTYRIIGHEQQEIFNSMNKEVLVDCVVISDGVHKVTYLDDPENPLIISIQSEEFEMLLSKFE